MIAVAIVVAIVVVAVVVAAVVAVLWGGGRRHICAFGGRFRRPCGWADGRMGARTTFAVDIPIRRRTLGVAGHAANFERTIAVRYPTRGFKLGDPIENSNR